MNNAEQKVNEELAAIDRITQTQHHGRTIFSGWQAYSFYAKCGNIYEGGHTSERRAINAVKRRLKRLEAKGCGPWI